MSSKKSLEKHYNKWGYLFVLPFFLAFLIFTFWPLACTVYYAFCDLKHTVHVDEAVTLTSLGLPWYKNFTDLLKTSTFAISIKNTFIFWICQVIPEWIIAFWLAAMMTDRRLKTNGRSLFRTAYFFPNLMSGSTLGYLVLNNIIAVVGSTVSLVLIATAMNGFGVTEQDFNFFLSEPFIIVLVSVFVHFGITFIYALVGMTSIPVEIFEAAEMDGSSRLNTFFKITLPCMRPILFFIVVLTVVDGMNMSDIPAMLVDPYDVTRKGVTMMVFLQNIFNRGNAWDRASAFSIVLMLISAAVSGLIYFLLIRDRYEAKLRRKLRKEQKRLKQSGHC